MSSRCLQLRQTARASGKSIFIYITWAECKCINVRAYEAFQTVRASCVLVTPADPRLSLPSSVACIMAGARACARGQTYSGKGMISLYRSLLKSSQDFIIPPFTLYDVQCRCLPLGGAIGLWSIHCHSVCMYTPICHIRESAFLQSLIETDWHQLKLPDCLRQKKKTETANQGNVRKKRGGIRGRDDAGDGGEMILERKTGGCVQNQFSCLCALQYIIKQIL